MATNQFNLRRTAFANFSVPWGLTNTTTTIQTDAYIPAGAIVTGIRFLPAGAFAGAATYDVVTMIPYVGSVLLGTNDRKVTEAIVETIVGSLAVVAADGIYVPTGGFVKISFGTTNSSSGATADADMYVDYLYCPDRDLT